MNRGWREPPAGRCPGVYVIQFTRVGWVYVGASFRLRDRLRGHFKQLSEGKHPNHRMRSAWAKSRGQGVQVSWKCLPVKSAYELSIFETKLMDHWRVKVGWDWMLNLNPTCGEIRAGDPNEGA